MAGCFGKIFKRNSSIKGRIEMKKQKIFYLDFIRVLSMFMIVTYHFYAHFAENNITGVTTLFANGRWGMIGVALFFMISGASLMYNYGQKLNIKTYVKKRFIGIYPMFWLAYTLLFVYLFYQSKGVPTNAPLYKLLFSFFAMDGYLGCYTETIYLIGEWFLGCIIIIYMIFPLLRKSVNKHPKITFVISTLFYVVVIMFYKNGIMPINQNLVVSTYSFILGMYAIKIKKVEWWQAVIGLIMAFVFYKLPANLLNMHVLYAGIIACLLYVVFVYIALKITSDMVQRFFVTTSKYSYAIFLVHHYIIMNTLRGFQNRVFGIAGTGLLYLCCWIQIIIIAKILYEINKEILKIFQKHTEEIKYKAS